MHRHVTGKALRSARRTVTRVLQWTLIGFSLSFKKKFLDLWSRKERRRRRMRRCVVQIYPWICKNMNTQKWLQRYQSTISIDYTRWMYSPQCVSSHRIILTNWSGKMPTIKINTNCCLEWFRHKRSTPRWYHLPLLYSFMRINIHNPLIYCPRTSRETGRCKFDVWR